MKLKPFNGWIAADNGYVFRTSNGAVSWTAQPGNGVSWKSVMFVDLNNGWLAGDNGYIAHTTNGGLSWGIQPRVGHHAANSNKRAAVFLRRWRIHGD